MAKTKVELLAESLEGTVAGKSLTKALKKGRTDDVLKAAIKRYAEGGVMECARRGREKHSAPISDYVVAGPQSKATNGLDPWCAKDREGYGSDANPVIKHREPKVAETTDATVTQIAEGSTSSKPKTSKSRKPRAAKPAAEAKAPTVTVTESEQEQSA